jgi:hypothetical protein
VVTEVPAGTLAQLCMWQAAPYAARAACAALAARAARSARFERGDMLWWVVSRLQTVGVVG